MNSIKNAWFVLFIGILRCVPVISCSLFDKPEGHITHKKVYEIFVISKITVIFL